MNNISTRNILFFVSFLLISTLSFAQVYTVSDAGDAGPGTFRQAVIDANGFGGPSTINFNPGINPSLTSGPVTANVALTLNGDADGSTIFGNSGANRLLLLSGGTNAINSVSFQDFTHTATTENGGESSPQIACI